MIIFFKKVCAHSNIHCKLREEPTMCLDELLDAFGSNKATVEQKLIVPQISQSKNMSVALVVVFSSLTDVLILADISPGTWHPFQGGQRLLGGARKSWFQLLGFDIFLCLDEKLWPVDTSVSQALRKKSIQYVY